MSDLQSDVASKPRSFVTLDLLRGIAALSVLQVHTGAKLGLSSSLANHALSVDFFLMLSGFMMTHAYQERLDNGWGTAAFVRARILRLYPLYLVGTVLGILFVILRMVSGHLKTTPGEIAMLALLGVFFLPIPPSPLFPTAPIAIYPFDMPAWSLWYQLVGYAVHGTFLRRRGPSVLGGLALFFGLILLPVTIGHGVDDFGPNREDYFFAFCRVMFAYPVGMILHRVWNSGRFRIHLHPLVVGAFFLLVMATPVPPGLQAVYTWFAIILLLPTVILLAADARRVGRMMQIFKWIGGLSFPLYILHLPVFDFFEVAWLRVTRLPVEQAAPWSGFCYLLVVVPTAFFVGKLYDPQARKLLQVHVIPAASRILLDRRRSREAARLQKLVTDGNL